MKLNHKDKKIWLIFTICFAIASIAISAFFYAQEIDGKKSKAYQIAEAYAVELKRDFSYVTSSTATMEKLVIAENGQVSNRDFKHAAKLLKKDYVSLIELVPNGVVTNTYPFQPSGKNNDLNKVKEAKQVLDFVKKKKQTVIYGPMPLLNAKRCVVVMNPVTLKNGKFWGYVMMTVTLPDVYEHTLKSLREMGYDYCIDTNKSPLSKKKVQVESSLGKGKTFKYAVGYTFSYGSCQWTLNIAPQGGWRSRKALLLWGLMLVIDFLISGLLYLLLHTREQKEELDRLAFQDSLTGLLNRRGFLKELNRRTKLDPEQVMTMAFIDLDDFKFVNDVYGHVVGDLALKNLARHLMQVFPENSLLGRTGGDEFCVVVPSDDAAAKELIEQAVEGVQEFTAYDKKIRYTISAGYADYPSQADSIKQLTILADEALYAAKIHGKNAAKHYAPRMKRITRAQLGFNVKNVAHGLPGGLMIYRADGHSREILFANDYLIDLLGCQSYEDFLAYTKSSYDNFILKEDFAAAEQAIAQQRKEKLTDPDKSLALNYRVRTKDGRLLHLSTLGRYVEDEYYGDVFVVFFLPGDLRLIRIDH